MVRASSGIVKQGILNSKTYLPTYLPTCWGGIHPPIQRLLLLPYFVPGLPTLTLSVSIMGRWLFLSFIYSFPTI